MHKRINETKTSMLALDISDQSSQRLLTSSVLTALASITGTAALVGIHHYYRKRHQPDASLQDYVTGVRAQWQAWQQAYQQYYQETTNAPDFTALHTTTMVARPVSWVSGVASMPKNITGANSSNRQLDSDFGVVGIDADRQIVWQTTMPERVHDIVVQPSVDDLCGMPHVTQDSVKNQPPCRDVVVMGRRPSERFWVLDTASGQVTNAIKAVSQRHFYGHACYSLDGKLLYVTENDTVSLDGKIGIYDAADGYKKIAEYDAYGIGPHELIMHPDGNTLVIANGGIKTERASREELNLDSMRPSLVYLNRHTGALLEQVIPAHNQMSVRHLAMHDDGTVMIGIQFQGDKHINVPLVLTHRRGDANFEPLIMPHDQWQRFHQYIASVAVDSECDLLCVTTPIGGCAAIYDLDTRQLIDDVSLPDCAGASMLASQAFKEQTSKKSGSEKSGFIVSDGQGQLTTLEIQDTLASGAIDTRKIERVPRIIKDSQVHQMSFDNHLQALQLG
ncbi:MULTISPECIES: DUF1513 domain-containing protein [unclassified Psychrobacter]|uniref:DUF1513 domain-containing protein n=1 Tax=unclassified Psychrobacter TaxID=196806 RepID=UPI003F47ACB9